MKNYYELLGISQTATEQEIKIAYCKLSQKFHPDKNDGDKFFEEMFKKIQEAYEVLGNAAQRKHYDLQLAKNANKQQTTAKNNFVPVIEIFTVNPPQVYSGEVIMISWKVFNADKITINLIGEVEAQGETTLRLNNLNANEFAEIKITATNTHINKATEKVIQVANKTYIEIKEKIKQEMRGNIKGEYKTKPVEKPNESSIYIGFLVSILLCLGLFVWQPWKDMEKVQPPPIEYDFVGDFREGLASVEKNGKWGFIDRKNNIIIPFEYDNAWIFSEGLASVEKNGKWGFIDRKNNIIIPFEYDNAWDFRKGLGGVQKNGKGFCINKRGEYVKDWVPPF